MTTRSPETMYTLPRWISVQTPIIHLLYITLHVPLHPRPLRRGRPNMRHRHAVPTLPHLRAMTITTVAVLTLINPMVHLQLLVAKARRHQIAGANQTLLVDGRGQLVPSAVLGIGAGGGAGGGRLVGGGEEEALGLADVAGAALVVTGVAVAQQGAEGG